MDIMMAMSAMNAGMHALAELLEGPSTNRRAKIVYHAVIGHDLEAAQRACQISASLGNDTVVSVFDGDDVAGGIVRIGIGIDIGDRILLQFGRLWMSESSTRAVLVPRGLGKRFGHYAIGNGSFVHRRDWPAADLGRGTERAEARLTELTIAQLMSS